MSHRDARGRCEPLEPRRHFAAGDLDSSFDGGDGIVELSAGDGAPAGGFQQSILVLPDDRIVMIGGPSGGEDLSLVGLTPTGVADTTFGAAAGRTPFSLDDDADNEESIDALYALPAGKILALAHTLKRVLNPGSTEPQIIVDPYYVRFNADGTLDTTFGTGGRLSVEDPVPFHSHLVIQPDGRLIVASGNGVNRYNADGSVDTTFGVNGFAAYPDAGDDSPVMNSHTPLVQPDGKIVVAGRRLRDDGSDPVALVRFNADGTPDAAFGNAGSSVLGGSGPGLWPQRAIAAPDGKILLAIEDHQGDRALAALRVNPDGSPDTTFGDGGFVFLPMHLNVHTRDVAIDADGRILVMGHASHTSDGGLAVVRLLDGGAVDESFGRVVAGNVDVNYLVRSFAMQSDGGVIVNALADPSADPEEWQPRLLKFAAGGAATSPITLTARTLEIAGSGDAERIRLDRSADASSAPFIVAMRNGIGRAFDAANVDRLDVDAAAGDDVVALGEPLEIPATIAGGDGNDRLASAGGGDSIVGGAGYDRVDGGAGNDTLTGGDGRDWIRGQDGDDSLSGSAWGDFLDGGAGDDLVDGGGYGDHLTAGPGADTLFGGLGDDLFRANDGAIDHLVGDAGLDAADADEDDVLTSIETT